MKDNELIAEFMGYTQEPYHMSWIKVVNDLGDTEGFFEDELEYRKSWDWLIPVVEKIEKCGCIVEIYFSIGRVCRIQKIFSKETGAPDFGWNILIEENDTMSAVYKAVVEFIKWHNANK